jgi:hypothetical protein
MVTEKQPTRRKKKSTTVYLEPAQLEQLHAISARTKVPVAVLIRAGIDMVLEVRKD